MAEDIKLPARMTVVGISQPGGPMVLKPEKRIIPAPSEGQILIEVRAAGVNRPDVLRRKGIYPAPAGASDLPGLEVSGKVMALGPNVKRWRVGDAVCALTLGGGYAQYVCVHETHALPIPPGFTMTEAAAIPETYFTVWNNLFERGGLRDGETVLVHGGSSGIGTTAIQLAKAVGATVITTAGSAEKCAACVKLGADRAVNYHEEDFVQVVKEVTAGAGANVILDMIGRDYVARNYSAAAMEGRIVQIATRGGSMTGTDMVKLMAELMTKRLTHTGSTLQSRSIEEKGAIAAALELHVWPLLGTRRVAPVLDMIFPLKEAWRAHERMEEGSHIGKIVLDVS